MGEVPSLTINQEVPEEVVLAFEADVVGSLGVPRRQRVYQRSATVPELFQLLLDAVGWVTLLKGASLYLLYQAGHFIKSFSETLGEKAGDRVWDGRDEIARRLGDAAARPIFVVARALGRAKRSLSPRSRVRVGITVDATDFGAVIDISTSDDVAIAVLVATLVLNAEALAEALTLEIGDRRVLGGIRLSVTSRGGILAEWADDDGAEHCVEVDPLEP